MADSDKSTYWILMISGIVLLCIGGVTMLEGNGLIGLVLAGLGTGCCVAGAKSY